jgi:hypothetical protein
MSRTLAGGLRPAGLPDTFARGVPKPPLRSRGSLAALVRGTSFGAAVLILATAALAQDSSRADGWVVLPIDEYRALRVRAFPPDTGPAGPPIDATLTRVEYDLQLSGDAIAGQARLTVDVLKQGWVAVQVPSGMLVRNAVIDGRPIPLVEDRDPQKGVGAPRVLLSRTGRTVLTLEVVVPFTSAAGSESMTLPATRSGLSSVTFLVPKTGVDLAVSGGFIAEKTEGAADSRWVVYGEPGHALTFNWKRKAEDRRATQPLKTRARIVELVALGEDATQVTASIHVDVTQGLARDAVVALPSGLIVNEVAGPNVADWNVDRGSLDVSFLEPVGADTSIVVTGETRLSSQQAAAGQVAIPIIRMPTVDRETGGVAVDIIGPGDIATREPRGLEPADPADLGDIVSGHESPSMAAFRFTPLAGGAPRSLTMTVTRYTPKAVLVANVEEARYDALVAEDGKLLVRARYGIRNNQRSFLAVTLPANATLWSASLAGRPVRPGVDANGALLLPLRKGRANEEAPPFAVELLYLQRAPQWSEKGDVRLTLPAVDLPVSRTGLTLHYSPRYAIDARPGTFRPTSDPGPFSAALRTLDAPYAAATPPPPASPQRRNDDREARDMKALLDKLQTEAGHTREGAIPVSIAFPSIGPSLFFEAELTAEAQSPALDLEYRRTGGR